MKPRLLVLLTLLLTLVVTRRASAEQRVEINSSVDVDTVEVGEAVVYALQVMVHNGAEPQDPKPGATAGFTLQGRTLAPLHGATRNSRGFSEEVNGLNASWTLRADRVGMFTIGPAQVLIGGTRRSATAVRVRVVERGKGPRRGARPPSSPSVIDPWKALLDFGDDDRRVEAVQPTADPKLALDAPRAPVAFLHATVDTTRAVVGEQVTLQVLLYEDPYGHAGRPSDVHESTATDFVKRSLMEDETRAVNMGVAMVGGRIWTVRLVRKNALFPLKTGHLAIEPMSMTIPQASAGIRASETLYVDVTEPPTATRPPGYAVGDVGEMALQATVTPRSTTRDGAVGVTIELRGTGNLPDTLTLPVVPGVEWLEQQKRDKLGAVSADRFGGTRTFSYVVRLHQEGAVDLGEIKLPFFDAKKGTYGTARATLGIINVGPGGGRDAGVEKAEIMLDGMPKVRTVLEGPRTDSYVSERPIFWAALFGSPLACVLAIGVQGLMSRVREKRAAATPSRDRLARERAAEADAAVRGDDGKAAMGAVARAVEAMVLARVGVNLRGVPGDVAQKELETAGTSAADASATLAVLRACEDARFSPDGVETSLARLTWETARVLLDRLQVP